MSPLDEIELPSADGRWKRVRLSTPARWPVRGKPFTSRVAFAAAHVVAKGTSSPYAGEAAIDWDATLAFRRYLIRHGFAVAEAMDTAQRNLGMEWPATQALIRRSTDQARDLGARIAAGAGTEHGTELAGIEDVTRAYLEQLEFVEGAGSQVIVMASRQLARLARQPDDYVRVYDEILRQSSEPVILHWLGADFDPELHGYWGHDDPYFACEVVLDIIERHQAKVDGVKVSLLDPTLERSLRMRLPTGVNLYTGDDYHYPELIRGDGERFSHALLGAFAAITPRAAAALTALDAADTDRYTELMGGTTALARHIFEAPTMHYKTGIAFMAWITGLQPGFAMVAGLQSARGILHLARVFELANEADLLPEPDLAKRRLLGLMDVLGVRR